MNHGGIRRLGARGILLGWLVSVFCSTGLMAALPGTLNFENVTATNVVQSVLEEPSNEKAVDYGDFDNDGDMDVVIAVALSDFGQKRNKLYRNDGGVFVEVSGAPIISGFGSTDTSRSAFFRDFDGDGWLDIAILNDQNSGSGAGSDKIFMNQHPGGVFSNFTLEITRLPSNGLLGASCSGAAEDFDQDGDVDVYEGNYPGPSQDFLLQNNAAGFFTDVTGMLLPSDGDYTVDISAGDLNGDTKLDVLISNHFGSNLVYYNDLLAAGTAVGDFRFGAGGVAGRQSLGSAGSPENSMEPGDLDGDGDQDIYWGNKNGSTGDAIWVNNGNNALGMVNWTQFNNLPTSVTARTSRKVTIADLNDDGRMDVFVMKEAGGNSRPTILRNTTVNGQMSFVDWTPGDAFPNGSVHQGWHAVVFDTNHDTASDIFMGGWNNDHLFVSTDSNEVAEAAIGGQLPAVYNSDPVVVTGTIGEESYILEVLARGPGASSEEGDAAASLGNVAGGLSDQFDLTGIPSAALVSVVLNGCGDFSLDVLNAGGATIASSERGGLGIEEALQMSADGGTMSIRVTLNQGCAVGGVAFRPEAENILAASCMNDGQCANAAVCVPDDGGAFPGTCYVPKNRFVSVQPNVLNALPTARRISVETIGGRVALGWIGDPVAEGGLGGSMVSSIVDTPVFRNWNVDGVVHISDCHISPARTYVIESTVDAVVFSPGLTLSTVETWGDVYGGVADGVALPPQGVANLVDAQQIVKGFQNTNVAPMVWLDLHPAVNNRVINLVDAQQSVKGFQGQEFSDLADAADPCECAGMAPCP